MDIPYDQISPEALQGLIEAFVTLEGTEYGEHDVPLDKKVEQVHQQLRKGDVVIRFDEEQQTCGLFLKA
ncbi:YheU family protein [Magnetococcus sp. PR-3]|uniref:YheU family protein n=1 Tax=Magnetococcus sp. PR-3 TaxID=3120355 RepID=UPI002FCE6175